MSSTLQLLIAEASGDAALPLLAELRSAGYEPTWERAETAEALRAALDRRAWDVVIVGCAIPRFSALEAVSLLKEKQPDVPIIIVAAAAGEDTALEAMRAGAHDYIVRSDVKRLVPTIERELREAEERCRRRRLEQELLETKDHLESLIDSASDIIYTVDLDGRITFVNHQVERVTGFSKNELAGKDLLSVVHSDDTAVAMARLEKLKAGESQNGEIRCIGKSGNVVTLSVHENPIIREGKVLGVFGIARDVTKEAFLEAQLRHAQKMEAVGQLAGGVAHDFNNLLTVILGRAQHMLARIPEDSPLYDNLREIQTTGERAAALVKRLLTFGRKRAIQPKVAQLNEILAGTTGLLQQLLRPEIELHVEPGAGLWPIMADSGHIEQVIFNLVVNARDAISGPGRITLKTENVMLGREYAREYPGAKPGRYAMLVVSDDGCGMSKEVQSRVFEPFFATKPNGDGSGLGLPVVYGIIKQHGGNIWVQSEEGKGTKIRIFLPALEACPEPTRRVSGQLLPRGSETVLVVDDEETVRGVIATVLSDLGYTIWQASDGAQALWLVEQNAAAPDLLLTDLLMAGMNGYELAHEFRRRFPTTRILFSSGYADNVLERADALNKGVEVLQKPFTPVALAQKVRETLDRGGSPR